MLVRDARHEHATSGWWAHLGNLAFNAGLTLFDYALRALRSEAEREREESRGQL